GVVSDRAILLDQHEGAAIEPEGPVRGPRCAKGRVRLLLGATCGDEGPDPLVLGDLPRRPCAGNRILAGDPAPRRVRRGTGTSRWYGKGCTSGRRSLQHLDAGDERFRLRVPLQGRVDR